MIGPHPSELTHETCPDCGEHPTYVGSYVQSDVKIYRCKCGGLKVETTNQE